MTGHQETLTDPGGGYSETITTTASIRAVPDDPLCALFLGTSTSRLPAEPGKPGIRAAAISSKASSPQVRSENQIEHY
jgi:hypothetical protein